MGLCRDYYRHALEEFLADNVQYMEIRTVLNDNVCTNLDTCAPLSQFEVGGVYKQVEIVMGRSNLCYQYTSP